MWLLYLIIFLILLPLIAPPIPQRKRTKHGWDGLPFVTIGLVLVNLLVFLFTVDHTDKGTVLRDSVALHWGLIPHHPTLITLLTHLFLHGGWSHIFFNMLFLLLFGPHVEEALGRWEYLLFYIAGGFMAGLLHVFLAATPLMSVARDAPLVGASGAIAAVLGLFAIRFWRAKLRVFLFFNIPAIYVIGFYTLTEVWQGVNTLLHNASGEVDNVANWAHVGGLFFGALIAIPLKVKDDSRQEYTLEDAESAMKENRLTDAVSHYSRYLEEKRDDANAHRGIARAYARLRQGEAAHKHFQEALRLQVIAPHSPANTAAIADAYAEATMAFETFPLSLTLLSRVAAACEETGNFTLAERALSELCRDNPNAKEAENAMFRLGRLYLSKTGQPGRAAMVFRTFQERYPQSEWRSHVVRLLTEAEQYGG